MFCLCCESGGRGELGNRGFNLVRVVVERFDA
jgi:hypothetical protein